MEEFDVSANHFKEAINFNDNFECQHFPLIYAKIADIFYLSPTSL